MECLIKKINQERDNEKGNSYEVCFLLSLFMHTSIWLNDSLKMQAAAYVNSKDLYKVHENNGVWQPIYNNQTVSV